MHPHSKIVIIGKPGSGKSVLLRDIIKAYSYLFPAAKIVSGTEENNHFYGDMVPPLFISGEYNEDEIKEFIKRQKLAKQTSKNPNALLVLDDCSDDPKFFGRPLFQALFKNGRHWNLMLLLALQSAMDIKPAIRSSVDYTFIFRHSIESDRKKIYENYASIIPTYDEFCQIMDGLAENYTAIVIDNRKQTNNVSDCVYYYKARMHTRPFTFGCPQMKHWSDVRFDKNYVDNIEF